MFSQALMYYAHDHFETGWAGEPEINPILDAPVKAAPEGVEMTPSKCLELAYHDVLADDSVEAGEYFSFLPRCHPFMYVIQVPVLVRYFSFLLDDVHVRCQASLSPNNKFIIWNIAIRQVCRPPYSHIYEADFVL